MATDKKNYVLGRGKLYFDPFAPGTKTKTGERYLGNTTEFNLNVESESLDHFNSDEGVRTKDDSVILELTRTGALTTDNISEENAALFVLGDVSEVSQTADPVVGENLGTVLPDRYYQLGAKASNPQGVRGVTAVTVSDDSATPVQAVEGTDYTLDAALGRIYILEGGLFDGTKGATVDYTPEANTRKRVSTNAAASVEGALRFVSFNAKGKQKDVYIPYVTLQPTGDWALKGDDWQNMGFSVEIGELEGMKAVYVDGRPAA